MATGSLFLSFGMLVELAVYIQYTIPISHGQINYIGTKAKCRHLKKLTSKGTLRQMFTCLSYTSPRYTLYKYMYLFTQGGGGGEGEELNQREGKRGSR